MGRQSLIGTRLGSNGVEFTSWDGLQRKMTAGQWASIIFQMVYMKRTANDHTTLTAELRRVGLYD